MIGLKIHNEGRGRVGSGISLRTGGNLIAGCEISEHTTYGVLVYYANANDANTVRENRVFHNGKVGIALFDGDSHLAVNNVVYGNGVGIQLDTSVGSEIYNNTVDGNSAEGILVGKPSTGSKIANNILSNNGRTGLLVNSGATSVEVRNNLFFKNGASISAVGNLKNYNDTGSVGTTVDSNLLGQYPGIDPLYFNVAGADYQLQASSPAKDAGISINAVLADFSGAARPQGSRYDIGAFESALNVQSLSFASSAKIAGNSAPSRSSIQLTGSGIASLQFEGQPGKSYELQVSSDLKTWSTVSTVSADSEGIVSHAQSGSDKPYEFFRLVESSTDSTQTTH
jgi:parallel beta-helix repeat protein